jgi:UDP-4-amino-4,6-dideoxy-N-acetyl-beta-L-altrosamine transaminase
MTPIKGLAENTMLLPNGRQFIGEDDIAEVVRVLRSDYLTTGPEVPAFEGAFATYVDAPHAIACSNGTAALHIIAMALGLGPGDQVIVPTISFVATANAIRYCGAEVIFADVDPSSGHVTKRTIADAINRADRAALKAIFVVHIGGGAVDLPGISELARELNIPLVEDACHAIGTEQPRPDGSIGTIGDCYYSTMAAFSFHPVKTMTTGEGGAVTTRDPSLARKLAILRNHGLVRDPDEFVDPVIGFDRLTGAPNPWAYELQMLGYNYRLTDFQAALGSSQLRKMPEFSQKRKRLANRYRELFNKLPETAILATSCLNDSAVLHLMIALIDFEKIGKTRAEAMATLRALGVGTQVHYIPIHRQPYYRDLHPNLQLHGSEQFYSKCLSLPLYVSMTEDDVATVVNAIETMVGG